MVRPTQERYLEDKPGNNKMDANKEGAINNEVVSVGSDFVVTNNCVREFTTNSLDMDTRRTVKTNNTMLSSTPISTSTSWTTPSPHPTTQAWSSTGSTPTTRLPSTSTSWTTPSSRSTLRTWIPAEPSKPSLTMRQSTLRIGYR